MTDAPERIWLQDDGDYEGARNSMAGTDTGVTWCDTQINDNDSEYIRADLVPRWSDDMDAAPETTPVLGWNKDWPHAQVMIWCKTAHVPLYGWHGLPFIDEDDDMLRPAPTHWMPLPAPPKEGK